MMKTLIPLLFTCFVSPCLAQVKIDKTLPAKYRSLQKSWDYFVKQRGGSKAGGGPFKNKVFFTSYATDTLSLSEQERQRSGSVEVRDINGDKNEVIQYDLPFKNLGIAIVSFPSTQAVMIKVQEFMGPLSISHRMTANNVQTDLTINYKDEKILSKSLNDSGFTGAISLQPAAIQVSLSDTVFAVNRWIYASVDLLSQNFYYFNPGDTANPWLLRYHFKYYFRFRRMR